MMWRIAILLFVVSYANATMSWHQWRGLYYQINAVCGSWTDALKKMNVRSGSQPSYNTIRTGALSTPCASPTERVRVGEMLLRRVRLGGQQSHVYEW